MNSKHMLPGNYPSRLVVFFFSHAVRVPGPSAINRDYLPRKVIYAWFYFRTKEPSVKTKWIAIV